MARVERALRVRGRVSRRGADLADRAQGDDVGDDRGGDRGADDLAARRSIGGVRNWDYRYCWLRDSVLALEALLAAGYTDEALAFRDFLLRVGTGDPATIQIMYGIGGERRLTEFELRAPSGLRGLAGPSASATPRPSSSSSTSTARSPRSCSSAPSCSAGSRRGCGRAGARSSSTSRRSGASPTTASGRRAGRSGTTRTPRSWRGSCSTAPCESPSGSGWRRRWSAGSRSATRSTARSASRATTPSAAPSPSTTAPRSSTRACSTSRSWASCPATDERVTGTIDAVSRELGRDGFVSRYSTAETDDGLPGDEGQFLACSFWLVSALALNGRVDEARALFERLARAAPTTSACSPRSTTSARRRQVGNFPQAFSHLTLILAARAIAAAEAAAEPWPR